jgi:hypothetical protein
MNLKLTRNALELKWWHVRTHELILIQLLRERCSKGEVGVRFPAGEGGFYLLYRIQTASGKPGARREADHSLPSSAEIRILGSKTSLLEVFMAWCLIKHRDNLCLYYFINSCIDHVSSAETWIREAQFQNSVQEPAMSEFSCRFPQFFQENASTVT